MKVIGELACIAGIASFLLGLMTRGPDRLVVDVTNGADVCFCQPSWGGTVTNRGPCTPPTQVCFSWFGEVLNTLPGKCDKFPCAPNPCMFGMTISANVTWSACCCEGSLVYLGSPGTPFGGMTPTPETAVPPGGGVVTITGTEDVECKFNGSVDCVFRCISPPPGLDVVVGSKTHFTKCEKCFLQLGSDEDNR
jgi:hypothetical protein